MIPVEKETLNAVQLLLGDSAVQLRSGLPDMTRKIIFIHLRERTARLEARLLVPHQGPGMGAGFAHLFKQAYPSTPIPTHSPLQGRKLR